MSEGAKLDESDPQIELADVQDAVLDAATLDQLFFDLSQLAELLEVRLKGGASDYAEAAPGLESARAALDAKAAVQIRYRYAGAEWIDTLMPTGAGVRLVRMKPPWSN
ncbi:MAG TPA: hypothetical protein VI072_04860 [Polyangiaceae bacterium]